MTLHSSASRERLGCRNLVIARSAQSCLVCFGRPNAGFGAYYSPLDFAGAGWARRSLAPDRSPPLFGACHSLLLLSVLTRYRLIGAVPPALRFGRFRDGLKTVEKKETVIIIPEAGSVAVDDFSEVRDQNGSAIFFHRGIRELPDGTLLACMIGSFEQDNMPTTDPRSKMETPFKMRCFPGELRRSRRTLGDTIPP